ncbi:MAG TPA: GNAT family N-acetyltransferase [Candidatus Dormibacteraeota bacterium]|nr:GNAT family N-acetyltransferase [Candidatus Dormibacteraeota bacterium]
MPRPLHIEAITAVTPQVEAALERLMPQLRPGATAPGPETLADVLADPSTTLLAACDGGTIVGLAVVAVYRRLSGVSAHLHDVVVDGAARRRGGGGALVEAAIEVARRRGAYSLELTSAPWREEANRLYPRLGFQRRDTNVYWLRL